MSSPPILPPGEMEEFEEALRERYPVEGSKFLAGEFGLTKRQVSSAARNRRILKQVGRTYKARYDPTPEDIKIEAAFARLRRILLQGTEGYIEQGRR